QQRDEAMVAAADLLCQDLRRKLTGEPSSDRYFRDAGKLADTIIGGGFETLAGVPRAEILMKYENRGSARRASGFSVPPHGEQAILVTAGTQGVADLLFVLVSVHLASPVFFFDEAS